MSNCPSCSKKLSFLNLLKSSNPMRIKCSGCKEKITIKGFHAIIAALIVVPLSLVALTIGAQATGSGGAGLVVALLFGIVAEFIFYKLVLSGTVKSNLVSNEI